MTVQGPVKKQQPDGMPHGGVNESLHERLSAGGWEAVSGSYRPGGRWGWTEAVGAVDSLPR